MKKPIPTDTFLGLPDMRNYYCDLCQYLSTVSCLETEEGATAMQSFRSALTNSGDDDGSISLQEHWAIYYELLGQFSHAALHRERQVSLIERLFEIGGPIGDVDFSYLQQVLQRLSLDYLECGKMYSANKVVMRTRRQSEH